MQTNPAVEQSNIIRWSESPWNQSGMKKGLWRKGFASNIGHNLSEYFSRVRLLYGFVCTNVYNEFVHSMLHASPNYESKKLARVCISSQHITVVRSVYMHSYISIRYNIAITCFNKNDQDIFLYSFFIHTIYSNKIKFISTYQRLLFILISK